MLKNTLWLSPSKFSAIQDCMPKQARIPRFGTFPHALCPIWKVSQLSACSAYGAPDRLMRDPAPWQTPLRQKQLARFCLWSLAVWFSGALTCRLRGLSDGDVSGYRRELEFCGFLVGDQRRHVRSHGQFFGAVICVYRRF